MDFQQLMRFAVDHVASDIHLQAGSTARVRIGGHLKPIDQPPLTDPELREFIRSIAPARFRENMDDRMIAGMDFSYAAPGLSRFRCSAYRHLGNAGITMRVI